MKHLIELVAGLALGGAMCALLLAVVLGLNIALAAFCDAVEPTERED